MKTPGSDILLRSDKPQVLSDNAFALITLQHYAEALPFARKAIRLALPGTPTKAYATFNLGLALLDLRRCRDSLPVLQHALTIEPASQRAYVQGKIKLARECAQS